MGGQRPPLVVLRGSMGGYGGWGGQRPHRWYLLSCHERLWGPEGVETP